MNTTSADPTAPPPPPRSSFSCDLHPIEQFTGFCPSCLCERLTTLDNSTSNTPSSSRRPSSAAAAAIKSLFSSSSKPNNFPPPPPPKPLKPTTFIPELRRSKSFSASKNEALGLSFEPQRKSCDVRARSSLSTLFSLHEPTNNPTSASTLPSFSSNQTHQITKKIESCVVGEVQNGESFRDSQIVEEGTSIALVDDEGDEIRPVQDSHLEGSRKSVELSLTSGEIVEEVFDLSNLKAMKDHIDLNSQEKKSSGGKIWAAASVFSKKWNNWRRKHKVKKQSNGENLATLPVEKPISRQFRETQSEIADYGFGRRSCDIDPRFSLDAGRMSFDDARYSFEEPRASWDGHLIGRSFPRMAPMVSVMEDARPDMQIPVEEPTKKCGDDDEGVPGGSSQTKEYYLDSSSSRRRKSLDRSSSIRKGVVAEIDEHKMAYNAKVSPATADSFHVAKVLVDSNSNSNSMRDDLSETFELSSGLRDIKSVVEAKETTNKSRRWSWRIWRFMQGRSGGNKDGDEEDAKYTRVNGVERSLSESWQETRGGGFNKNMYRSNSSVSWRNGGAPPFASGRKSSVEMYGNGKKRKELVLEKNRSGRYSPQNADNGLLRFYLTPMRGSRRGGTGKIKPTNSQPIARSVLRLY
ncbi:protein OCTOPUS-like [Salvia hispanica]|uniref:protein OCTOPUS-like n=1 Tax=Salvia hispanica TaxID=49212 RepID=UPI00200932D3|nr:protein OCTOPUS-like [Salvia hispanica]